MIHSPLTRLFPPTRNSEDTETEKTHRGNKHAGFSETGGGLEVGGGDADKQTGKASNILNQLI